MINMLLSHTTEIDDHDAAVKDVLPPLGLERSLKKRSLGIIHCSHEYLVSGAAAAISRRLPFPVVGMNTLFHSTSLGIVDGPLLSLSILTSDDVDFKVSLSEPIELSGAREALLRSFGKARELISEKPSLCLIWSVPRFDFPYGETIVESFEEVMESVPLFGAFAADYTTYLRSPMILFNGEAYSDRMAIVLLEGPLVPNFRFFSAPCKNVLSQKAVVTESEGNIVKRVNGRPALDFMDFLGLCHMDGNSGTHTIPVFIDRHDGAPPSARGIIGTSPEGHIILSGKAPEDSTLGIGALDLSEIIRSIQKVSIVARLLSPRAFFLYSCISRNFALGLNYTDEAEAAGLALGDFVPYLFAYSFGEICPYLDKDGKLRNEFHNMALVTASF
jgi:hypothetical protein